VRWIDIAETDMAASSFAHRCLFHLMRAGFRLAPMPATTRDRLRQRFLERHQAWVPAGPRGIARVAAGQARRPLRFTNGPAIGHAPYREATLPQPLPATLVAFYLPQFHPIPENDAWWGKGFTEWSNVTRALPQFDGHAQPRLPGDLGFYDLRNADIMRQQMHLAQAYGVSAFCTYFYWFAGKTLLEAPLQAWLADASLDLPICLCWANENWSRRWDGRANDILIGQKHTPEDDIAFIEYVSRYLADPRYLRVGGAPLLVVYRPGLLPDAGATALRWREWCRTHGIGEIHLAYVQSFDRVDPRDIGFDAAVEFPPNNTTLPAITGNQQLINPAFSGDVFDWRALARQTSQGAEPKYRLYPGVNPGWDNEARRNGRGRVYLHASPRGYRDWLRRAIDKARQRAPTAPLVFINAWNEWAEGAVLEPEARLGHAWLEATRSALQPPCSSPARPPCVVIHAWNADSLGDIARALRHCGMQPRVIITTSPAHEQAVRASAANLSVEADIEVFDDRGRDVLPFLHVANRLLDEGDGIVLKLQTPRFAHRRDDEGRHREDVAALLSNGRVESIVDALQRESGPGLVMADRFLAADDTQWIAHDALAAYLCRRMGVNPSRERAVEGSMFWARLEALRPLLDAHLELWEFEDGSEQEGASMVDAIERCLPLIVASAGHTLKKISY
jgi:lipopolysaccharide biosynthesis protein